MTRTPAALTDREALARAVAELDVAHGEVENLRHELDRESARRADLVDAIRRTHEDDPTHRDAWIWCDEAACRAAREAAP